MSRMPFGRFLAASVVGAVPFALAFAYLGSLGRSLEEPVTFMVISIVVPMVLWVPVAVCFSRSRRERPNSNSGCDGKC